MELRFATFLFLFLHPLVGIQAILGEEVIPSTIVSVDLQGLPQRTRVTLGQCRFGERLDAVLVIHNRSTMRLTLRAIDPDCGCLAVTPDRTLVEHGESVRLKLELAAAKKLANIRREIRILFDESSAPLVVALDVRVVGPFTLEKPQFSVGSARQKLAIVGSKTEPGLTITGLQSVRGAFRIEDGFVQDQDSFRCEARPLVSFGSVIDFVRVNYHDSSGDRHVLDLPVELSATDPIRFLPSRTSLTHRAGHWRGNARMILASASGPYDVGRMNVVVHGDQQRMDGKLCRVDIQRVSPVLCLVEVDVSDAAGQNPPRRLEIRDQDEQQLGTLYFSYSRGNQ